MPLQLRHRINEGMRIIGHLKNNGKAIKKTIDVVVRDIVFLPEKTSVDFELINGRASEFFTISEREKYAVLSGCVLYLPKDPVRIMPLSYEDSDILNGNSGVNKKRVLLVYFASRIFEFSERRIYPLSKSSSRHYPIIKPHIL